jgi:hypothetical protein
VGNGWRSPIPADGQFSDFQREGLNGQGRVMFPILIYQPLQCLSRVSLSLDSNICTIEGLNSSSTPHESRPPATVTSALTPEKMQYRTPRFPSFPVALTFLLLSISVVLPTVAIPVREIGTPRTIDNPTASTPRTSVSMWVELLGDWVGFGGNRARLVAEMARPHIKRWHGRKKYRGVHH